MMDALKTILVGFGALAAFGLLLTAAFHFGGPRGLLLVALIPVIGLFSWMVGDAIRELL